MRKNIFIFGDSHIALQKKVIQNVVIPGIKIYSHGIFGATLYGINKHFHIFQKFLKHNIDIIILHLGMNDIDALLPILKKDLSVDEIVQKCIDNMNSFMLKILRIKPNVNFYVCNVHNDILPVARRRFRLYSYILKNKLFNTFEPGKKHLKWFFKIYRSKYVSRNIGTEKQQHMLETNVYYKDPLFQKHIQPEDSRVVQKHIQNRYCRATLFNSKLNTYCKTQSHATLVNISWDLNRVSRQHCVMNSPWQHENMKGDNHFADEIFFVSLMKAFHRASSLPPLSYVRHTQKNMRRKYQQTLKKYRIDARQACTF